MIPLARDLNLVFNLSQTKLRNRLYCFLVNFLRYHEEKKGGKKGGGKKGHHDEEEKGKSKITVDILIVIVATHRDSTKLSMFIHTHRMAFEEGRKRRIRREKRAWEERW